MTENAKAKLKEGIVGGGGVAAGLVICELLLKALLG